MRCRGASPGGLSLFETTTSIEFNCKSITACREMRSAVQSVGEEIKESRRLKIISSTFDPEEGLFGPDPRTMEAALSFADAKDTILGKLHQTCVDKLFYPGECILAAGNTDREMYYIISGSVRFERDGKLVDEMRPGNVIGVRAFLHSGNAGSRVTAIAQSQTTCMIITPKVVNMLEQHEPKHAARFYRGLALAVAVRLHHALANVYTLGKTQAEQKNA
ncbi:hypothetical protein T484DRAFT_2133129 [Baffinella frigidus]|nr:hypothetical protein T484DRAFT_2133129 [Cryptophyta sp. CCMP2293]